MPINRLLQLSAGVLAITVLAAGCGDKDSATGSSTPESSPTPTVAASLKVRAPLPTDQLVANPCTALATKQLPGLGIKNAEVLKDTTIPGCKFNSTIIENEVFITPLTPNTGGISDLYAQKAESTYFIPAKVDGYPAVYQDKHEGRPSGNCTIWVGVTDQLAVGVNPMISIGHNKTRACALALTFAQAMVKHLQGKA